MSDLNEAAEELRKAIRKLRPPSLSMNSTEAAEHLGVNKNFFRAEVAPYLNTYPVGQRMKFDRLEIEQFWEDYKARNVRPALIGDKLCENQVRASSKDRARHTGKLKKEYSESMLERVLEQIDSI